MYTYGMSQRTRLSPKSEAIQEDMASTAGAKASPRRSGAETRELIFAACSRILQRDGLAQLTLDAVAQEAGLSKGGLLYHFPTKLAMIEALFQYHTERFNARLQTLVETEESDPGGWLRAYAKASMEQITDAASASLLASLFAAGERYPSVLEIMRQHYVQWQQQVEAAGLEPALALLVRLAVDGFWFTEMYQYAPLSAAQRQIVLEQIVRMTRTPIREKP
ncbi:MAG: TetR/AcrR family transcriptional regulator [Caldilineaceae bacterium]